jgi:hypothetical protein
MMTVQRKRLIRDLALTGIAAPLVILLLILARAAEALVRIMTPILYLGQAITSLIGRVFPPRGGGMLQGFGRVLVVDFILMWIVVWIVLFAIVKLIQKLTSRNNRELRTGS